MVQVAKMTSDGHEGAPMSRARKAITICAMAVAVSVSLPVPVQAAPWDGADQAGDAHAAVDIPELGSRQYARQAIHQG
jgi:hypothetical protein